MHFVLSSFGLSQSASVSKGVTCIWRVLGGGEEGGPAVC